MSLLQRRSRTFAFLVIAALAAGFLVVGLFAEAPRAASAIANCGGQELAGRWVNHAKQDGSDLLAAVIAVPCTSSAAAAGRDPARPVTIGIELQVRCLHFLTCDWRPVEAAWGPPNRRGGNPVISAQFDQERFERAFAIEPIGGGKLRLTLTSHFKGLGLPPVQTVYTLERQGV